MTKDQTEKNNLLTGPAITDTAGKETTPPQKPNIYGGPITNAFMQTNTDIGTIEKEEVNYETRIVYSTFPLHNVRLYKWDLFNDPLSPSSRRLIAFCICKLAQNIEQHETNINKINEARLKPFPLTEFMDICKTKDRKEVIKIIKKCLSELLNTRISYDIELYTTDDKGKRKKTQFKQNTDILTIAIKKDTDNNENLDQKEYINHCIEKGLVYIAFDLDLTIALINSPLLALPPKIFELIKTNSGKAFEIAFYLINLYNMGYKKTTVSNILNACPDIPKQVYDKDRRNEEYDIISKQGPIKDTTKPYKHLIEPLEKTLETLKKENILKDYKLTNKEGHKINFTDLNYNNLESSYIGFDLTEEAQPRTPEQIAYKKIMQKNRRHKKKSKK